MNASPSYPPRWTASELREKYQRFFEQRGHRRIPSAPLLPENDPTALFTSAGMQPLVPFLLGEPHPAGKRLVNVQRCIRTGDIDEVGDSSHLTFFEMLGNWSLGDYFKQESLTWSWEFLTQELGLHPERLAVTVFAGDESAPRDEESAQIWRRLGIPDERIFFLPKEDNWWGPVGSSGPCGPDSEIFYDTGLPDHQGCQPGCPCGRWLEIWNNVFMEYNRQPDGTYTQLSQPCVDTGMGLDRTAAVLRGESDVFQIETLRPIILLLENMSGKRYADQPRPFRIIADHLRAASLAIVDGATPSNLEAGYVVRRLIRRAIRQGRELGIHENFCARLAQAAAVALGEEYPGLVLHQERLYAELDQEETKFKATLDRGLRQVHKTIQRVQAAREDTLSGEDAFTLFETFGFPLELTRELAQEQGLQVDAEGFYRRQEEHRELSRLRAGGKFQGGLADHTRESTRMHTAAHLLQAALRQVLGPEVRQMGSNITPERVRFDFAHDRALTPDELRQVEALVNQQIAARLPVNMEITSLEQALAEGALAFFGEKYGEQVKVYSIGEFSKEVCGGPHVEHTGELGAFRILKQEAVGRGVRRIRAVLD
jgi:alanyl-tRNA synthetase